MPNSGNMAVPLCFLAFGQEGLEFGIIVYTAISMGQFTLSVLLSPLVLSSLRELARISLIYTAVAALALMAVDYVIPNWLANTARMYGRLVIPLMLIALGVSLASLNHMDCQGALLCLWRVLPSVWVLALVSSNCLIYRAWREAS